MQTASRWTTGGVPRGPVLRAGFARATCSCAAQAAGSKLQLLTATPPSSRDQMCLWWIKELGIEDQVAVRELDIRDKKEHKSEEFLLINPFGIWPALVDGDLKLFESGAILMYLAEQYGHLPTPQDRAAAAKWLFFANSTLSTAIFVEAFRHEQAPHLLESLDKQLSTSSYIAGDAFSISDVAVGSFLLLAKATIPRLKFSLYPNVLAYMQRIASRPAAQAAMPSITVTLAARA